MQKQIINIPGYRVNEYLLVLRPHDELRTQLQQLKKSFAEKFKAPLATQTKPQLALVNFFGYQIAQQRIVDRIGHIAMGISPFKVEINGFGSFPSHTIYAAVTSKVPIKEAVREVKAAQALLTLNKDHKPHFIEEPHFTICHKLKPWQYEQAWLEYSHTHFSGRFIADGLILLKRTVGETRYEELMRFEFASLSQGIKQGSLFG